MRSIAMSRPIAATSSPSSGKASRATAASSPTGASWREVNKFANVLKSLGVKKGDRVTIYMGRVPELVFAMLACAKIGAVHSVVYGGFSEQALADRIEDAQSKVLVTCDGAWLRGNIVKLKDMVDEAVQALAGCRIGRRGQAHRA